jgi:hypothetical protein
MINLPKDYDKWKTATPYDDEKELFESDLPVYYSDNEMDMSNFEDEVRELAKQYRLKKESEL